MRVKGSFEEGNIHKKFKISFNLDHAVSRAEIVQPCEPGTHLRADPAAFHVVQDKYA
jgi:hypothetical protein